MRSLAYGVLLGLLPVSLAEAQDIAPVISPGQVAEGVYYRSRMAGQAKRSHDRDTVTRTPTLRQRQICASRPRFRAQLGAEDVSVRKLEALCAGVGL